MGKDRDPEDFYHDYFDGMIDELRIHDIALTPCEFLLRPAEEYAGCPNPYDTERNVDVNVVLSWAPGIGDPCHDVYLSTSYDDVNTADDTDNTGIFLGNIDVNHWPAEGNLPLEEATMYYWRVDERNGGPYRGLIWSFETASPIVDPNLRVWYKLDEASGYDVADYSGRYFDTDVDMGDDLPPPVPDWDPSDGRFGGSLGFNNDTELDCPTEPNGGVLGTLDTAISVSVWLKDAYRPKNDNPVFSSRADEEDDDPNFLQALVVENSTGRVLWRAGDDGDVLRWSFGEHDPETLEDWHHWVFIKDETADSNHMRIYFDGELVASESDVNDTLNSIRGRELTFGNDEDGDSDFVGRMDDVRVYDKALDDVNITTLFRGGDLTIAWSPDPGIGESDVAVDLQYLTWKPGDDVNDANGHDVYFGTNYNEVLDANSTIHPNVDYNNVTDTNYGPAPLELGQTYYWRVDEVNDPCVWTGVVWWFTVAEFITIDDMEEYTSSFSCDDYPITSSSCENYGWEDGYRNGTGSSLALVYPGSVYNILAHRGDQAMYYFYYNDAGLVYSEIWNHFDLDPNWTRSGVKMLTLWFYGEPGNESTGIEPMYVGLDSGPGSYSQVTYGDGAGEDGNDIAIAEWQEWNIALSEFATVDLEDVNKLYIGFGDREGSVPPGRSGEVYFDDIRLYPSTCVLSQRSAAFAKLDLWPDCVIDFDDVDIMAGDWLEADVNFSPVTKPDDANLLGWWNFDEDGGAGSVVTDSSSNGHDGVIETIDVNVSWVAGHPNDVNYALDCNGGRVRVLHAPELIPMEQVSVSAWIKYSDEQNNSRVVAKGADDKETYQLEVDQDDDLRFSVRDGNNQKYAVQSADDALDRDTWAHVAGTYDGNNLKCYINGQLEATTDASALVHLSQDTNDLAIGNKPGPEDDRFVGIIDDVRIYDYGLSADEVEWLASDGTGLVSMRPLIANVVNDEPLGERAVNLRDFAALAVEWLEEEKWP
jgi:hypothetical protein